MQFHTIQGAYRSLQSLIEHLDHIPRKRRTLLIGVDGCGGSGKSTCAGLLAEARPDVTVVHMDDFYLPSALGGGFDCNFDWARLREQVLEPLAHDQAGTYQIYDWPTDRVTEAWHTAGVGGIVVVEGVTATRRELAGYYDFRIWVECPRELRLARGLERDGLAARDRWEHEWMVAEDRYMAAHDPQGGADLILDGTR